MKTTQIFFLLATTSLVSASPAPADPAPSAAAAPPAPPPSSAHVSMPLALAATDGGKTATKAQCRTFARLSRQQTLAANETWLAKEFDNYKPAMDAFKARVAASADQVKALADDKPLMGQCQVLAAHQKSVSDCATMWTLERMTKEANDTDALNKKFAGNTLKVNNFQQTARDSAPVLKQLSTNNTLTQICAVRKDRQSCNVARNLQSRVSKSKNATWLDKEFAGNKTLIERFKTRATDAQVKLDNMMGNKTLRAICKRQNTNIKAIAGKKEKMTSSPAPKVEIAGGAVLAAAFVTALMLAI